MTKESSKPSISSSPYAQASTKEDSKTKPIKLRAACNNCFSAKVRCDGNKEGCQRCRDKNLCCVYSESRVGKVVGKRRKRPLEGSFATTDSDPWIINQSSHFTTIPSPPASHYSSDSSSRRQYSTNSWASFLIEEHQDLVDFEETCEPRSFDGLNPKAFCESSDMSFLCHNGLATPGMSPPQFRYLSPAALEARPMSRATSVATDRSRLLPPRFSSAFSQPTSRTPESTQPEDDETVCIKLLAHLKKHASQRSQNSDHDLDLLRKTNASVRRILSTKAVRSDYTCQLLLSSIVTHIVDLCEQLCNKSIDESKPSESSFLQEQIHFEAQPEYFNTTCQPKQKSDPTKIQVLDATYLATEVADLLKRKPASGFQVLGRHEIHHIELDLRLQRALSRLA